MWFETESQLKLEDRSFLYFSVLGFKGWSLNKVVKNMADDADTPTDWLC